MILPNGFRWLNHIEGWDLYLSMGGGPRRERREATRAWGHTTVPVPGPDGAVQEEDESQQQSLSWNGPQRHPGVSLEA